MRIAAAVAGVVGVADQALATNPADFTVNFQQCTEFVGVAGVNGPKADALVPNRFTIRSFFGIPGQSSIVVRVSNCESVSIDGGPGRRGTVAHIGLNIEAPDDPGSTIDNYTNAYASDNTQLVAKLQAAGVPAAYDSNLTYVFSPSTPPTGNLFAAVAPQQSPQWVVLGHTGGSYAPFPGLAPFIANWWRSGNGYATKMNTVIDSILFYDASTVSFFTSPFNFVGNLIASHTIGPFGELPVRGTFANATMQVTVRP
ncbi:MAG: hypothetical protein ACKVQU_12435 [Burkholderiales bacterium]